MTRRVTIPRAHRPVIELLFEAGGADELAPLVRSLTRLCTPVAPDPANAPAARLLSSPDAPESHLVAREPSTPFAVVIRDPAELGDKVTKAATALVVIGDDDLVAAAGERAVRLSATPIRTAEVLPVPPFLRSQLRAGTGLPDPFVVTIGRPGARSLDDNAVATALRLATVADVCGPAAAMALTLGTPVVTDQATAAGLGATDGTEVLVAASTESDQTARDLAADPDRCAELSRRGRLLIEQRHDPDVTAAALIDRLGFPPASSYPTAVGLRLGERLHELGTPSRHPVEMQFASRLADLGVAPRSGGR